MHPYDTKYSGLKPSPPNPPNQSIHSCTGCAPAVVAAYRAEGFRLVLNVCNGSGAGEGGASYLEVSVEFITCQHVSSGICYVML